MRVFFNVVGSLLTILTVYFGYLALNEMEITRTALQDPAGQATAALGATAYLSLAQSALLSAIGAGVFLGAAAILEKLERRERLPE